MKKNELKVGSYYLASVNDQLTIVRFERTEETPTYGVAGTRYHITNMATGVHNFFRSPAKFRAEYIPGQPVPGPKQVAPMVSAAIRRIKAIDELSKETEETVPADVGEPGFVSVMDQDKPLDPVDLADTFPATPLTKAQIDAVKLSANKLLVSTPSPTLPLSRGQGEIRGSKSPMDGGTDPSPKVVLPPSSLNKLGSAVRSALAGFQGTAPHVIVRARAGTGKTTTLIEGLKPLKGFSPSITPSEQQREVWKALEMGPTPRTICMVAFNSSIVKELQSRVPAGVDAMTMHSLGFRAVRAAFSNLGPLNKYRVSDIIAELLGKDIRDLRKTSPVVVSATEKLVALCKQNLVGYLPGAATGGPDHEDLAELANHYQVDLASDDGKSYRSEVFALVPRVLERCLDVRRDGKIDFNDMIWLPIVLNLPVCRYDLLLVDEAQDLNRCQQELAKKAGARLIFVGDDRQAIYGFAGADSESMDRLYDDLGRTSVGVVELPLTVTRRCGKAIVAEAQKIVPDFSAHEGNPEGLVSYMSFSEEPGQANPCYRTSIRPGDMALCRVNAPLVSQCFKFIREGRKATIQGKDIAQGLILTITKMKATSIENLIEKLEDWAHKEISQESVKRNPNEDKIIAIQDRVDCLMCFTEGSTTINDVIGRIEAIFTDDKHAPGIRLSSIHKAKGLEAHRVFFLRPEGAGCPHPMARTPWQQGQEQNLCYVATTRAIEELVYVS